MHPTRVDICSPPQNLHDQSGLGLFKQKVVAVTAQTVPQPLANVVKTPSATSNDFHVNNLTFAIPETGATSTPAKPPQSQEKSTGFGLPNTDSQPSKPAMTSLFGGTSSTGFGWGGSKEVPKPFAQQPFAAVPAPAPSIPQNTVASVVKVSTEANKPFLTVQPIYKPVSQTTK